MALAGPSHRGLRRFVDKPVEDDIGLWARRAPRGGVDDAGHDVGRAVASVEFAALVLLQPIGPEKNRLPSIARQCGCGEWLTA